MLVRTPIGRKLIAISTIAVRRPDGEPVVLNLLRDGNGTEPSTRAALVLTPRQVDVLQLLAQGEPAKAIALRFGLRETTVRNHIAAILRRLESHSQLEAVAEARRRGLI
jgi:DNA-binding NarL/FixJ family response regulator